MCAGERVDGQGRCGGCRGGDSTDGAAAEILDRGAPKWAPEQAPRG